MHCTDLCGLSNQLLHDSTVAACARERESTVDVVRHFVEVERRKLYLLRACSTLMVYAEKLGFTHDEAKKRVAVARIAVHIPQVFEELEQGRIHLTGLYLLANRLTPKNASGLLAAARGLTRNEIALLIATRFPKPDVPDRIREIGEPTPQLRLASEPSKPSAATESPTEMKTPNPLEALALSAFLGPETHSCDRIEPLSGKSYAIQFTASESLVRDIQEARELSCHAIRGVGLAALFGRALGILIKHEKKRLMGSDKPRESRKTQERKPDSRYIPKKVQRAVRERDCGQCAFVDDRGVRCDARLFLTVEHKDPHALEGDTSVENCCLLCASHNLLRAKQVFGEEYIAKKIAGRKLTQLHRKVQSALVNSGYKPREAKQAVTALCALASPEADLPTLIRAALQFLGT